jgi:hypothetical protein
MRSTRTHWSIELALSDAGIGYIPFEQSVYPDRMILSKWRGGKRGGKRGGQWDAQQMGLKHRRYLLPSRWAING